MALTKVQGGMVGNSGVATLDGIQFPAVQVPSSDANCLDDYEEGSFDATISMQSGSVTLASGYNKMNYIKIGKLVQIQGQIQVSAVSTPSGECKLVLPFVSGVGAEGEQLSCGAVRLYNQTIPASASYVVSWTDANSNYAYITGVVSNSPVVNVVPQVNGYFVFGFTYTAAS